MPALAFPVPISRPSWSSSAEKRLWSLWQSGHPAPVDTVVTEVAQHLGVSVQQAKAQVQNHLDLAGMARMAKSVPHMQGVCSPGGSFGASAKVAWDTPSTAVPSPMSMSPVSPKSPCQSDRGAKASREGYVQAPYSPVNQPSVQAVKLQNRPDLITVAVVAPGAGAGINAAVYSELNRQPFKVYLIGESRAAYDQYPLGWPDGAPAPNLQSFAEEVMVKRIPDQARCMVFGSRGGQVVLPLMWHAQAQKRLRSVPPSVVVNGGCAMKLPMRVQWPDSQVLFLLLGGNDIFRQAFPVDDDYIEETRSHVPTQNKTTAILFIKEMTHNPQQPLFQKILAPMLKAVVSWKATGRMPLKYFHEILCHVRQDGWSGRFLYTTAANSWEDIKFGPRRRQSLEIPKPQRPKLVQSSYSMHIPAHPVMHSPKQVVVA